MKSTRPEFQMPSRPATGPRGGAKLAARAGIRIGCAGWALRKEYEDAFPPPGTHLARYAARFNAAEINSSFYRPHRRTTYERLERVEIDERKPVETGSREEERESSYRP